MRIFKDTALLFIIASVANCGDANKPPAIAAPVASVKITLRAIGTETQVGAITASVPDGTLATPQDRTLPWEASYTVPQKTPALVKVENKAPGGSVKCQILVDGSVVKEAESTVAVNSATCLLPAT